MYWADEIVKKLKGNTQHVADGKTPSGRIHVGSLRGVMIHDAIVRALLAKKVETKFSYIFDDLDPFDTVPAGLNASVFKKYLGMPLNKVPSPGETSASFAECFADEFVNVFTQLGVEAKILWQSKLHEDGTLDEAIRIALDKAAEIANIYQEVSGSKNKRTEWVPFQPICQKCGKIGTTKATKWDGKEVEYECLEDLVSYTLGCGYHGKVSPFGGTGKLPWKVYWPARWFALNITIEGEGKDLASKGGARDVANHIAKKIYKIDPPLDIPYEFFLFGGAKMSTSKGIGVAAAEMLEILPAKLIRFLMLYSRPMQAINFDPTDPPTIPKLFDEYDKTQVKKMMRFKDVVNLLQMPGKQDELNQNDVKQRVSYARIWLDRFAPEDEKFTIKEEFPEEALHLSGQQKEFLQTIVELLAKDWEGEKFQNEIYNKAKEIGLSSKDAFSAVYLALLGKDHGPKAAWLILSLDRDFVKKRFQEV